MKEYVEGLAPEMTNYDQNFSITVFFFFFRAILTRDPTTFSCQKITFSILNPK